MLSTQFFCNALIGSNTGISGEKNITDHNAKEQYIIANLMIVKLKKKQNAL